MATLTGRTMGRSVLYTWLCFYDVYLEYILCNRGLGNTTLDPFF